VQCFKKASVHGRCAGTAPQTQYRLSSSAPLSLRNGKAKRPISLFRRRKFQTCQHCGSTRTRSCPSDHGARHFNTPLRSRPHWPQEISDRHPVSHTSQTIEPQERHRPPSAICVCPSWVRESIGLKPMRCFGLELSFPPLYRTSHRGRLIYRTVAGFGHLLHRLEKVASGIRDQRRSRTIKPSAIL